MFNVGSVQGYLKLNTTGWTGPMRSANAAVGQLTRSFTRLGVVAVGSLFLIEREFGKFDKAIRHATSVSETTQKQFERMSQMALDASVQWNKAATQTAQAFYFLGSAGLTVTEQMEAFNDTIMLSRAMGSELGQTVEGVVDIVRAFGLEFADITNIADQLTKTVISSNQQFRTLSQALSYASSTARLTNNTLAETTAMLGVMANAGIKGSMAGTVLRRAMTNLMSPTGAMAGLIYELGLNIYDSTGRMRPFITIMGDISDQLKGTSEEYRNMIFEVLFGRRAIAGQIQLFNYGSDALAKYASVIENAGGTTERVAGKQMKAFTEQLGQMWQQVKRASIMVGELLAPSIEALGDRMQAGVTVFENYIKANEDVVKTTVKWLAVIGGTLVIGAPLLLVITSLVKNMAALALVITSPFVALITSLYVLRAVWKQTSREMIERTRMTVEAILYEKIGPGGIIAGAAAAGAITGSFLGLGIPGAIVGGVVGAGVGVWRSPEAKKSFEEFRKNNETASLDLKKLWAETSVAITSQFGEDFGKAGDVVITKLEDIIPGFKKFSEFIQELVGTILDPPKPILSGFTEWVAAFNKKVRESSSEWRKLNEAVRATGKTVNYIRGELSKALKMVFAPPVSESKTWFATFTTLLESIQSSWADAFDNLMKKGSSFGDFMNNLFNGILNSLTRMIAEIAAADLLYALAGGGVVRPPGTPTIASLFSIFSQPKGAYTGGLKMPPLSPAPSHGLGMFQGGNVLGKAVPGMVIEVKNDTSVNAKLTVKESRIVGKRIIINAVMEEYNTNPNFRNALGR